ncbi:MAG: hypothetical protein ACRC1W_05495 [Shewanella sp.]
MKTVPVTLPISNRGLQTVAVVDNVLDMIPKQPEDAGFSGSLTYFRQDGYLQT